MRLCDEVAALAAIRNSRRRVVTAAVDRTAFLHTIQVGELLTLTAIVNAVWRSSMEVGVLVEAENAYAGQHRHTNSAYLTMVAVDDNGRPVSIPPLLTERRRACDRRSTTHDDLLSAGRTKARG